MVESGKFGWAARTDNNLGCTLSQGLSLGVSQIIGEICLTIGGFDEVDGFGLT